VSFSNHERDDQNVQEQEQIGGVNTQLSRSRNLDMYNSMAQSAEKR